MDFLFCPKVSSVCTDISRDVFVCSGWYGVVCSWLLTGRTNTPSHCDTLHSPHVHLHSIGSCGDDDLMGKLKKTDIAHGIARSHGSDTLAESNGARTRLDQQAAEQQQLMRQLQQ